MNLRKDHSHEMFFPTRLRELAMVYLSRFFFRFTFPFINILDACIHGISMITIILIFFAAVNVLARVAMKDVANCDTHCELRSGSQ